MGLPNLNTSVKVQVGLSA